MIRHAEPTDDRTALQRAVEAITAAPHTRIDLALDAAAEHLASARHAPDHHPVIVMMTDGPPTNTTTEAVRLGADSARSQATLFAIGVGPDVDRELLVDVAGDPGRYFPADDADALAAIYRQISELIPCEGAVASTAAGGHHLGAGKEQDSPIEGAAAGAELRGSDGPLAPHRRRAGASWPLRLSASPFQPRSIPAPLRRGRLARGDRDRARADGRF